MATYPPRQPRMTLPAPASFHLTQTRLARNDFMPSWHCEQRDVPRHASLPHKQPGVQAPWLLLVLVQTPSAGH